MNGAAKYKKEREIGVRGAAEVAKIGAQNESHGD